jgi:hypothetical protein
LVSQDPKKVKASVLIQSKRAAQLTLIDDVLAGVMVGGPLRSLNQNPSYGFAVHACG